MKDSRRSWFMQGLKKGCNIRTGIACGTAHMGKQLPATQKRAEKSGGPTKKRLRSIPSRAGPSVARKQNPSISLAVQTTAPKSFLSTASNIFRIVIKQQSLRTIHLFPTRSLGDMMRQGWKSLLHRDNCRLLNCPYPVQNASQNHKTERPTVYCRLLKRLYHVCCCLTPNAMT